MNTLNSLVSICIPTYNSAKFLRQCLESIVAQTYKKIEVIISDNASIDDTPSIINEYANKHGFAFNRNAVNIGAAGNFNKLISMARGKYIAIYHADDVYEPTIVEESVNMLECDETVGLVGTMGNIMNEEGTPFNTMRLPKHLKKLNKTLYTFDEALSGIIKRGWFFVTPSIMVRAKVYRELGIFDQKGYGSSLDYEMWMRIATRYNIAVINKRLINYRVHKDQGTEREVRKNPEVADIVLVIRKYREMTTDKKVKRWCEDCIHANIIAAARRQNYYGLYDKSNETLKMMKSKKIFFLIQRYGMGLFNALKVSVKNRKLPAQADKPAN